MFTLSDFGVRGLAPHRSPGHGQDQAIGLDGAGSPCGTAAGSLPAPPSSSSRLRDVGPWSWHAECLSLKICLFVVLGKLLLSF